MNKLGEGSTPGPWKIVHADKVQHAWEDNPQQIVADDPIFGETLIVTMGRDQQRNANAALIAKAPLLIEARDLITLVEDVANDIFNAVHRGQIALRDNGQLISVRIIRDEARALLAKIDAE